MKRIPPPCTLTFSNTILCWYFIFLPVLLAGQTQLFTEYQPGQFQWPAGAYARYQYLLDPAFSKEVRIISTLDVRNAQSNGLISFLVPGTQTMLAAEASLISDNPNSGFTWSGKILNAPGYIVLIHRQGQTAGFVQIGPDFYEISPIDNNYQFLIKRKNDIPAMNYCPVGEGTQDPPPEPGCDYDPGTNFCPATITVLLILTPEAAEIVEDIYGSVDNFALLGQASVNTAFWNSDIPNKEIRVKWVVKSGFPFSSPPNLPLDFDELPDFAEPERTIHKADLVSFVPHIIYPVGGGVGNLPDVPNPAQAFSIITIPAYMGLYGFAHEIGHNLGCHHNWPFDLGNDQDDVCAHAYRWLPFDLQLPFITQQIESWRTIVGKYYGTGEVVGIELEEDVFYFLELLTDYPILHYSNPIINYDGERTGRPDDEFYDYPADNANQIRAVGCAVDDYNPAQELNVNLSTPVCTSPTVFSAIITPPESGLPGIPPYTVTWFWSESGIFGTNPQPPVLGTGSNITLSSFPACTFFVKCVVVSADNVQVSRIQKVVVGPCPCYPFRPSRGRDGDISDLTAPISTIYPNPASNGMVEIQFSNLASELLQLSIHDTHNRLLISQHYASTEEGKIQVPLNDLPNGFYILRLFDSGGILANHKLIIQSTK